jgi:tRNA(Ile2)-agmatinylcytidine synthase
MILAFDDTDSTRGGCTTYLALRLLRRLGRLDLIGPPRLVRLNPNVPHKTRGNGAIALRLGHGRGAARRIGFDAQGDLWAYAEGDPPSEPEMLRVFEQARRLVEAEARVDEAGTNPGLVAAPEPLPEHLYWNAVRRYVSAHEGLQALGHVGARFAGWKNGRGLIGAASAAAWPAQRGTFEWIAYRTPQQWGRPRDLAPGLGDRLDRLPHTFDNQDRRHGHLRVAPASPCPILIGVRGTDARSLPQAADLVGPERPDAGLLFATNQATDDHLAPRPVGQLRPFQSASVEVHIVRSPQTWRGGHVFVRAADSTGGIDLAAFEPTKEFRGVIRELRPGDRVRAHGGVTDDPTLLALEKVDVLEGVQRRRPRAPECTACRRRMASRGRGAPYRCPSCGARATAVMEAGPGEPTGRHKVPTPLLCHPAARWRGRLPSRS